MTDINDLYEPADERDWTLDELAEREPDEPEQEPPLDLDEVEAMLRQTTGALSPAGHDLLDVAPRLVAELREARRRIAEWEALPIRAEYATAVGGNTHPDDCKQAWHTEDSDQALAWHKNVPDSRMWTRSVPVHEWVQLSPDAPF